MEQLKSEANKYFRLGKYTDAMDYYTKAIEAEPLRKETAPCFGNRSFAACKLEQYGQALQDAHKAIELDPYYIKAYYRRAAAYMALNQHKAALDDFKKVAELQEHFKSQDKFIYAKIKECEKLIHRLAFERAISVEAKKEKPLAYTVQCDSIPIEGSYEGPKLKNNKQVTLEFVEQLIDYFKNSHILHRRYVLEILCQVYKYFVEQPSLIDVNIQYKKKFTVVGDIHGQFFDLLNIFKINGLPSEENPYLFNGDIVDRGSFSIECILLLLSFKILYPKHFYISRGNHETHTMNQMYGFEGECKHKYSAQIYEFFTQVFQVLPLAHCLTGLNENGTPAKRVLVMHGGLFSQDNVKLDDIRKIDRNKQPPNDGLMCEILWSDPMLVDGRVVSKRGIAIAFGPDVTKEFCENNNLDYIIRSHEVKQLGYEVAHGGQCITVFSAPNYCDTMGNQGAIVRLEAPSLRPDFLRFDAVSHPDMKPMAYANHLLNLL
uniref:protein-serine/threonine phosphatase n=1 Tax=Aceria tosichella TaxID=561515 RepID=A0A6G1SFD1_9ACAR